MTHCRVGTSDGTLERGVPVMGHWRVGTSLRTLERGYQL
jgi:hypothetical protein